MRQAYCRLMKVVCAIFVLPYAVLSSPWMDSWQNSCEKRDDGAWSIFQNKFSETGYRVREEKGLSNLADDIRTGALRLPDAPHVYALMGGGEWGARAVAKAVLESVYVDPWNHVVMLDMEEAAMVHRIAGLDEARLWLKEKVASAIHRCPGKAAVVFDNVHVLKGEDVLLLDPFLLLFEDGRSNMAYGNGKVSGDGSVFLLLFNEEYSDDGNGLDGKARLQLAWEFKDERFTTTAFVGRVDAAALLPTTPFLPGSDQSALEDVWREASGDRSGNSPKSRVKGTRYAISAAFFDAWPPTIGTVFVAIITASFVALCVSDMFAEPEQPSERKVFFREEAEGHGGGDDGNAGGPGKNGKETGKVQQACRFRGGGTGGADRNGKKRGGVFGEGTGFYGGSDARDCSGAREGSNASGCGGGSVDVDAVPAAENPPSTPPSGRTRSGKAKSKKAIDVDTVSTAAVTGTSSRRGWSRADSAHAP